MKYFAAIAVFLIAGAFLGGDRIERAARAFVAPPQHAASSAADCRAAIPKGSSLGQAAMYVIAHCEDPPPGCRPNIPPEKLQGKTYREVEIRALIACGTRAELQADFNRTRDQRNRQIAAAQSDLNASVARSQAAMDADKTTRKLDDIDMHLQNLGMGLQ